MNIFVAKAGTSPIYSDGESEIEKYASMRNLTRKGSIYSAIIALLLTGMSVCSLLWLKPAFLFVVSCLLVDICVFIFNFMPYIAYNRRMNQIKKYGKCNDEAMDKKVKWILDAVFCVSWLAIGVSHFTSKLYASGIFFLIASVFWGISALLRFRKYKKRL